MDLTHIKQKKFHFFIGLHSSYSHLKMLTLKAIVLYHLVNRIFGPAEGLLAALTLAVTPISVATPAFCILLLLSPLSAVVLLWKPPMLRYVQLNLQQRAIVFWLTWLVPMTVSFATATLFHRYYTVMMAPAIAALSGVGLVKLWRAAVNREKESILLFPALSVTGIFAVVMVWSFPPIRIPLVILISSLTLSVCLR